MQNKLQKVATDKAPQAIGPYSQGIIVNGVLYSSGQIAINPKTGNIDDKTVEGQTEQVMQNLKAVLEEAGSDFTRVIKTTCFLADINDFATFNAVYGKYFTEKPARSCVAVKDLPKSALVEVEVIALVD